MMADEDGPAVHPLSWRDVYSAVGQMEERMTKVLERIEQKFDNVVGDHEARLRELEIHGSPPVADHETRLRTIETYADALPQAERAELVKTVHEIKGAVEFFKARESGVFGTLRGVQLLVVVVTAVITVIVAVISVTQ